MRNGSSKAVELPDYDGIETTPVGIDHESIQLGTLLPGTGYSDVHVFTGESPAAVFTASPS